MILLRCLLIICLFPLSGRAQLEEHFNALDTALWKFQAGDWAINSEGRLQSQSQVPNQSFFISTKNTLALACTWELDVKLSFNPSSQNYVDIYLSADSTALQRGYFIRVGNTSDEVSLYRKDGSQLVKLIDGQDGRTDQTDNRFRLQITRTLSNEFILLLDFGTGWVEEGRAVDATYLSGNTFGILVRQSTSGFFRKHSFDDIVIRPYQPDTTAPALIAATASPDSSLLLEFDEPLAGGGLRKNDFVLLSSKSAASDIEWTKEFPAKIRVRFDREFAQDQQDSLLTPAIPDLSGNIHPSRKIAFRYHRPTPYDVIITEIMADPSPTVSLPECEYVEIKNCSLYDLELEGWKLCTPKGRSKAFSKLVLKKDSFLLLLPSAGIPAYSALHVLTLPGFPGINNSGDTIWLEDAKGRIIFSTAFTPDWYENKIKSAGGWSLEMRDASHPCGGQENWSESAAAEGGTPGRENSVSANGVQALPSPLRAYPVTDSVSDLLFSRPLGCLVAAQDLSQFFHIDQGPSIVFAEAQPPLFETVRLHLSDTLRADEVYQLRADAIPACPERNTARGQVKLGKPSDGGGSRLVLNEILFDPPSGFPDFVELYNYGHSIVNLNTFYLANRSAGGGLQSATRISPLPRLLFPGEYVALTSDTMQLRKAYYIPMGAQLLQISLPSFPDDDGSVVLTGENGRIWDELHYDSKWHFPLLTQTEGVSLERIDPRNQTQLPSNWHSASSTSGFGTPGYLNSQSHSDVSDISQNFLVEPRTFTPDNDGRNDFVTIRGDRLLAGSVLNLLVYDLAGKRVRVLASNQLLGNQNFWTWDGLDEKGQKLFAGTYILVMELFTLQGKTQRFKTAVALLY